MKKKYLTLLIALFGIVQFSYAQNTPWSQSGHIGIGTTSPESGWTLDVNGLGTIGTSGSARLYMGTIDATHALIQSRDLSINQKLTLYGSAFNFEIGNLGICREPAANLVGNTQVHSMTVQVVSSYNTLN